MIELQILRFIRTPVNNGVPGSNKDTLPIDLIARHGDIVKFKEAFPDNGPTQAKVDVDFLYDAVNNKITVLYGSERGTELYGSAGGLDGSIGRFSFNVDCVQGVLSCELEWAIIRGKEYKVLKDFDIQLECKINAYRTTRR